MAFKPHLISALIATVISVGTVAGAGTQAPGLHATPSGVPWFISDRQSRYPGAEAAMRIASSKWGGSWAEKVKASKASAKFRLVTVNGSTYLVLAKIRGPFTLSASVEKEAHRNLINKAASRAGCTTQGRMLVKYSKYNDIQKISAQVDCSFI